MRGTKIFIHSFHCCIYNHLLYYWIIAVYAPIGTIQYFFFKQCKILVSIRLITFKEISSRVAKFLQFVNFEVRVNSKSNEL